jgi:P27 family predicted phage terminase small subunit
MQRGAKPVPTTLKLLRGNPGHRAIQPNGEPQPQRPATIPDPPRRIKRSEFACEEWNRIAPELWRLNLLTVADIPALAIYCQAYAHWCEAEEALYVMKEDDPKHHGLIVEGPNGGKTTNPLVKIAASAALNVMRFAVEFGFTPASRTRISGSASGEEPDRKFAGLLANQ